MIAVTPVRIRALAKRHGLRLCLFSLHKFSLYHTFKNIMYLIENLGKRNLVQKVSWHIIAVVLTNRYFTAQAKEEAAESVIKKYSNGRYDHNIDALYDAYIEAKKKYKEVCDQGHRDKLMECVCRLMVEVYDMLSSMAMDSDFKEEKDEIMKHIRRLADS